MNVDPGEGYRLLIAGETIVSGDQFVSRLDGTWKDATAAEIGFCFDPDCMPFRRKCTTPTDDSINRVRKAMQNHSNWADILFGELTEPLRTDIKLVLEHYMGEGT